MINPRVLHLAALVNNRGHISPLCASPPRALNPQKLQSWTLDPGAVTCPECLAILRAQEGAA